MSIERSSTTKEHKRGEAEGTCVLTGAIPLRCVLCAFTPSEYAIGDLERYVYRHTKLTSHHLGYNPLLTG